MKDKTYVFIGIDPGNSGAIAIGYLDEVKTVALVDKTNEELLNELLVWKDTWPNKYAIIEKVHSMPQDGVASAFKFGLNYGKLLMALTASKIPYEDVSPITWQKALGVSLPKLKGESTSKRRTRIKNALREKAQQLFPQVEVKSWNADAILLAEYARRKTLGLLTIQRGVNHEP